MNVLLTRGTRPICARRVCRTARNRGRARGGARPGTGAEKRGLAQRRKGAKRGAGRGAEDEGPHTKPQSHEERRNAAQRQPIRPFRDPRIAIARPRLRKSLSAFAPLRESNFFCFFFVPWCLRVIVNGRGNVLAYVSPIGSTSLDCPQHSRFEKRWQERQMGGTLGEQKACSMASAMIHARHIRGKS